MADIVGRYVQIGVDSPENIQSFGLTGEFDTSQLTGSGVDFHPNNTGFQDCRVIYGSISQAAYERNESVFTSFGVTHAPQYAIISNGSTYKTLMTTSEYAGATNRHFEPVTVGEKPIDWDETYKWKYWEKTDGNSTFPDMPQYKCTAATWDATKQYYANTQDFHYYYIVDGEKQVRVGIGDTGLSFDNHRMGLNVGSIENGDSGYSDGYFTFLDGETEKRLKSTSQSTNYYTRDIGIEVVGVNQLFAGNTPTRYLFATDYNSHWRSSVTEEQKGQLRTRIHNDVTIKNVTSCRFGFLNHEGHRYFGIWVIYPEFKYYIGYNRYARAADNPYTNESDLPTGDLRLYNYDDPIPENEIKKIWNIRFYGVELDPLQVSLPEKEGQIPPNINPNPNPSADWPTFDPVNLKGRNLGSLSAGNEAGFHVYSLDNANWKSLVGRLWDWANPAKNIWTQLKTDLKIDPLSILNGSAVIGALGSAWDSYKQNRIDPLNAIMFAERLPTFIHNQVVGHADYSKVNVAGLQLDVSGYVAHQEVYYTKIDVDCSNLLTTDSYLDMAPYSTAEIYLPLIGMVNLNPSDFVGGHLEIYYNVNIVTGDCSAHINAYSYVNKETYHCEYGPFEGSACYRLPLAVKDANAFERQVAVIKAAGSGFTTIAKNIGIGVNALQNVGNGYAVAGASAQQGLNFIKSTAQQATDFLGAYGMQQMFRGTTFGTGGAVVSPTNDLYIVVNTPMPKYLDLKDYETRGGTSGRIKTVSECDGYCRFKYINTNGIEATAAEIEAIQAYLTGGVYL